ncbi:MAG: ABC transporter ATP-binding protein [Methanobacteriota archaeon]|nr:MAG: ABC transporter ATP-binding protein [Euryarchaeota archaeon]
MTVSDITVSDLIKVYKRGKLEVIALRGLDATFPAGKVTWVRGPSGCGKTTLLNLVGGLDRPTAGSILVDDANLAHLADKELVAYRRDKVGFVFQFFNLVPVLTAAENVELPMRVAGVVGATRDARVQELLAAVGVEKRARQRPDELSGGEQQRVAIAVALANDPTIVLADEPTGELDSENATLVLDLLRTVSRDRGKTVLLVSHDPHASQIADVTVDMADGRIVSS